MYFDFFVLNAYQLLFPLGLQNAYYESYCDPLLTGDTRHGDLKGNSFHGSSHCYGSIDANQDGSC